VSLIGVVIYIDSDGVKMVGRRQLHDKINADILLRSRRNFLKLENGFEVLCRLVVLTLLTAQDILVYKKGHLRLPV
jgi:hypothetical protein